jgi:hypothetical protein
MQTAKRETLAKGSALSDSDNTEDMVTPLSLTFLPIARIVKAKFREGAIMKMEPPTADGTAEKTVRRQGWSWVQASAREKQAKT